MSNLEVIPNWKVWSLAILMGVVSLIIYSNTLHHKYAWDDRIVITENPYVQSGFAGLKQIWIKRHSEFLHDQIGYRPVPLTMFAIEQEYFPNEPKIGHAVNMILYALLSIVVIWFLYLVVGVNSLIVLFLIGLIYTAHPLHAEVVANIKSRDELLQFLFGLLSLITFKRWMERKTLVYVLPTILFLLLSILSKENGIATVGLMFLMLVISAHKQQSIKRFFKGLSVVVVLAILGTGVVYLGLSGLDNSETSEGLGIYYESPLLGDCFRGIHDSYQALANKNLLLHRYIAKFLVPTDLTYYSGFSQITMYETTSSFCIAGILGTVFLLGMIVFFFKKNSTVFFGALLFLVLLSPFLHVLFSMPDTMADRYMFGASLGLSICLVCIPNYLIKSLGINEKVSIRVLMGLLLPLAVWYMFLAHERSDVWFDNYTLFKSDLNKLDNCAKAHEFYADALHQKLERTNDSALIPEIVEQYERSIQISELSYYSFIKLGSNYAIWGNANRGIELLERAVELFPNEGDPHFYLANALYRENEYAKAIPHLHLAVQYSPRVHDSYYLLIRSFIEMGQLDSAMVVSDKALKLFPKNILIRDATSDVYTMGNNLNVGFAHVDTIISLQPLSPVFWKKAIGLRQKYGLNSQADSLYREALKLGVEFGK